MPIFGFYFFRLRQRTHEFLYVVFGGGWRRVRVKGVLERTLLLPRTIFEFLGLEVNPEKFIDMW